MLNLCAQWEERISAYLDNEATAEEIVAVEQHLRDCADCRAMTEFMRCDQQDAAAALLARGARETFADAVMGKIHQASPVAVAERPSEPNTATADRYAELTPVAKKRPWYRQGIYQWVTVAGVVTGLAVAFALSAPEPTETAANDSPSAYSEQPSGFPPGGPMPGSAPGGPAGSPAPGGPATSETPTIMPPERNYGLSEKLQIAYKAEMSFEAENVQDAMEKTELLFRKHEGFVLSSDFSRGKDKLENADISTIVGYVPNEKLGQLLVELGKLGTVTARKVTGDDLTAQQPGSQQPSQQQVPYQMPQGTPYVQPLEEGSQQVSAAEKYQFERRTTLTEVSVEITQTTKGLNYYGQVADRSLKSLQAFGRFLLTVLIPLAIWSPVLVVVFWVAAIIVKRQRKSDT